MGSSTSSYYDDLESQVFEKRKKYLLHLIPEDLCKSIISTDEYKSGGILLLNRYRLTIDLYVKCIQIYDTETKKQVYFNTHTGGFRDKPLVEVIGEIYGDPRYYYREFKKFKEFLKEYI